MVDQLGPHDFVYLHGDIPEGMMICEWRRQRAAARAEMVGLLDGLRRANVSLAP